MKNVLELVLLVMLIATVTFTAFADMSPSFVTDFSFAHMLDRMVEVTDDFEPFPPLPSYPETDTSSAGFFGQLANFFEFVFDVFGWVASLVKWIFDDLILGFRFIGCFLPITYTGG